MIYLRHQHRPLLLLLLLLQVALLMLLVPSPVESFRSTTPLNSSTKRRIHLESSPTTTKRTTTTTTTTTTLHQAAATSDDDDDDDKVAVLVCPAQFCVPADYVSLEARLRDANPSISSFRVTPLPRTEWIKVAKSLPTKAYLDGSLECHITLSWYFQAMEVALRQIMQEEGPNRRICIVGHSIGGWVGRAYLGGLGRTSTAIERLARITSLVTLGTPHINPESAWIDQTRGLLRQVETTPACSSKSLIEDRGIQVTCVGSNALKAKVLSTDLEELVAVTSYLPLLGRIQNVQGDGIVPTDLAFMEEPARRIEVSTTLVVDDGKSEEDESTTTTTVEEKIGHAHVLPTPWKLLDGSAPSLPLPSNFRWYGSEGVVEEWAKYVV